MVRPVVLPHDLPDILGLEEVLFPENSMGERMLTQEISKGKAWVAGEPVHAYALIHEDGDIIDLTRLGVLPGWQNRGVGKKLLDTVLELGKETMLTVSKANLRAISLYLGRGFCICGALQGAWVMWRPVRSSG